jgi:glycosyltransferase involved in cell wall biosynthesis
VGIQALTIRGPFHGPTGYDHHVRETAKALHELGVTIELIPLSNWGGGSGNAKAEWFESLVRPVDSRTVVHITLPEQVVPVQGKLNANFTMFETDRIPERWLHHSLQHDLVVVPTESSRRAWMNAGYAKSKTRLCPLAVDAETYSGRAEPLALRFEDGERVDSRRVRLLNVSEFGSRKNLLGLMRAWLRATSPLDDAALILKVGCYIPGTHAMFLQHIQTAEIQARKTLAQAAPICFIYGKLAEPNLPRLFTSATHYLSMSTGEGWDLPMMEAAASGLRLIAPEHSAYTEYLDSSIATLIPAHPAPADFRGDPATAAFFRGSNWWVPDESRAMEAIREAIEGRDSHKQPARDRIAQKYTWTNSAKRLLEIVGELESPQKKRWSFAG